MPYFVSLINKKKQTLKKHVFGKEKKLLLNTQIKIPKLIAHIIINSGYTSKRPTLLIYIKVLFNNDILHNLL